MQTRFIAELAKSAISELNGIYTSPFVLNELHMLSGEHRHVPEARLREQDVPCWPQRC